MEQSIGPGIWFGREATNEGNSFTVPLSTLENGFYLALGKSGSGKTTTIRKMIDQLMGYELAPLNVRQNCKPTFHIIGYHPDYQFIDFLRSGCASNISEDDVNVLSFDYDKGNAGINVLEPLIKTKSEVYKSIEDFVALCQIAHPGLGLIQKTYLKDILAHVITKVREEEDRAADLTDLYNEIVHIQKSIKSGLTDSTLRKILRLKESKENKNNRIKNEKLTPKQIEDINKEIEEDTAAIIEETNTLIKSDEIWVSGEYYSEFDVKILSTIQPVITELIRPKFFTRKHGVAPKRGKINFYDISMLDERSMSLMTRVLLSRIFNGCRLSMPEEMRDPEYPNTFIIADEVRYMESSLKSKTDPGNLIVGGGRKFGLAMWVGGQSADQLSDDMISAFSLKIIMEQNDTKYKDTYKHFRIKESLLNKVKAKQTGAIKVGSSPAKLVNLFKG